MVFMEINRSIINKLASDFSEKSTSILVGARQVGKTYLMCKIEERAKFLGLKTAFFDLEQPNILLQFNKSDSEIIELLASSGNVVFIDEFQYLENASHIFKAVYDSRADIKIFASGSSSLKMHKHIKESLAGRKFVYQIHPCSFLEMGQVISVDLFDYYCVYGGLPGLIHFGDAEKKKLLLSDILQSYILKDVKSLIKEENIRAFNNLLYLLAQWQGGVVTLAGLSREIGLTIKTVESYLEILNQTYVCFPINSFSLNFANELKKSKKYYLYDLGVRNTLLKNFAPLSERNDAGSIVESFVFLELHKQLSVDTELRFWRLKDGAEVDFIWIKNQKAYPIEVKTSWNTDRIPDGLKAFFDKYPATKMAFVISNIPERMTEYKGIKVYFKGFRDAAGIPNLVG